MGRLIQRVAFFTLILLIGLFSYGNQLIYNYLVPPGGDALNHNFVVQEILSGQLSYVYRYHSIWHLVIALLSKALHIPPISVMAWTGPALLATTALSVYYFNNQYFTKVAAITSLVLIGFFSMQPFQTLYDGGFPNVLAAGIILPFVMLLLEKASTPSLTFKKYGLLLLGFFILFYSHHLTTLYTLAVVICYFITLFITNRKMSSAYVAIGIIALTLIGTIVIAWFLTSSASGSVGSLSREFVKFDFTYPFIHLIGKLDNPNAIWPLAVYPNAIGEAVVFLGMGGWAIATFRMLTRKSSPHWRVYTLLVIWTTILFIASRIESLGFPVRLARDLVVPLTLLAGLFMSEIYIYIKDRRIPLLFFVIITSLAMGLGSQTFADRYTRLKAANPLINHLRVDSVAAEYITFHLPLTSVIGFMYDDIYLASFTPLHSIRKIETNQAFTYMRRAQTSVPILEEIDYLYLERRFDRDSSELNNDDLIRSFQESPYTTQIATFKQSEKAVYLFRVNKRMLPGANDS